MLKTAPPVQYAVNSYLPIIGQFYITNTDISIEQSGSARYVTSTLQARPILMSMITLSMETPNLVGFLCEFTSQHKRHLSAHMKSHKRFKTAKADGLICEFCLHRKIDVQEHIKTCVHN